MPRLGELLVAAGLLTVEQVDQALRAQVMWGGRLGTNLVELHYLDLDTLTRMLARQHRMPAALARHFEKADPELQRMLSQDFAERFSCVPLLRMGPERHVAVASIAPLAPRQLAIIADELAVDVPRLVPAIAAELRVRYQLERVYSLRRAARFLRARGETVPPFPAFQGLAVEPEADPALALPVTTQEIAAFRIEPDDGPDDRPDDEPAPAAARPATARVATAAPRAAAPHAPAPHAAEPGAGDDAHPDDLLPIEVIAPTGEVEDLALPAALDDDLPPAAPAADPRTGRERRTYIPTIADPPADGGEAATLGRIAIRKVAVGPHALGPGGPSLGEATRAIRRSTGRDRVAELVIDTLDRFAPQCSAAILLVIRGATAIGWKGFQREGGAIGEIAVPMENGGMVPSAVAHNATVRRPCSRLDAIDRLLLAWLGGETGDLVIVPIAIADQVMCVIALATPEGTPVECAEPIAAAAGAAFARLMRDASR